MSDSEDPIDLPDEGGDDLFGDDDGDAELPQSDNERAQSDKELASDPDAPDDDDDDERRGDDDDDDGRRGHYSADQVVKERTIMNVDMFRHRTPKAKDGNLSSMKVPKFLKWQADEYKPASFQPTQWDLENTLSDNPKAVIRYKRDPDTGHLKSNTNIYRWSDGSITMAVGNEHYEVQKKLMIPNPGQPYEERLDSHYYAAAAHLTSNLLMTVGHISEQFTVNASKNMQDEALANFASAMAAAARGKRNFEEDMIITTTKDPELQKKEAELAEKERAKAQRRRDTAAAKLEGRAGGYKSGGGGLSIGDLEGGRKGGSRKRGAPGASRPKKRRPEYDSDDDLPAGTRYREDDYDEEDDFIAASDDDGELVEDDDDDLLDDDEEEERPRKKRQKTVEPEDDDEVDADGDAGGAGAETARSRRRHIVDDDDDDDEE